MTRVPRVPMRTREDRCVTLAPMVPYLAQLENPYDANRPLDCDPYDLVRFALGAGEYWADKALDWLSVGLPAGPLEADLRSLADDKGLPQRLRHRAFSLWKQSGRPS
jgi:hypothetical protein